MPDPSKAFRLATAAFLTGAWIISPLLAAPAEAVKDYPNKPIRFIVQVVAGGGADTTARAIAQKVSEAWGRQIIVDNRPGASGAIAVDLTAKAVPDGYTIGLISAAQTVNSAVNPKLPYDLTKDLAAISRVSSLFLVVFHSPSIPVQSIKDLIAYAKVNPGKFKYGTTGAGSMQHIAWEMFSHMAGVKLVHVPYKGGSAAIAAMLAGDIQVGMTSLIAVRPRTAPGNHREETLPGAKVSPAIIRKLNAGIADALKSPDVVQRLGADGSTPDSSSPEEFGAHIKSEIAKWRKLVKDARLVLN